MRHRRIGRVGAAAAILALVLAAPSPDWVEAEAQYDEAYCRTDYTLENDRRRVTGIVETECHYECFRFNHWEWCHDPPYGNWGVSSKYGPRIDGFQFTGWYPSDGWLQWNSCTTLFNQDEHFNDGNGRQRSDGTYEVGTRSTWYRTGYRHRNNCRKITPEVHTERDVEMRLYELDPYSFDDHVTDLEYGSIDTGITCSSSWDCSGTSPWHSDSSNDGTGVSADVRLQIQTSFEW